MDHPQSFCPATKEDVTNIYTDKSQRIIGDLNPDQAPWADLNLLPPIGLNTCELTQRITEMKSKTRCEQHRTEATLDTTDWRMLITNSVMLFKFSLQFQFMSS